MLWLNIWKKSCWWFDTNFFLTWKEKKTCIIYAHTRWCLLIMLSVLILESHKSLSVRFLEIGWNSLHSQLFEWTLYTRLERFVMRPGTPRKIEEILFEMEKKFFSSILFLDLKNIFFQVRTRMCDHVHILQIPCEKGGPLGCLDTQIGFMPPSLHLVQFIRRVPLSTKRVFSVIRVFCRNVVIFGRVLSFIFGGSYRIKGLSNSQIFYSEFCPDVRDWLFFFILNVVVWFFSKDVGVVLSKEGCLCKRWWYIGGGRFLNETSTLQHVWSWAHAPVHQTTSEWPHPSVSGGYEKFQSGGCELKKMFK